MSYLNLIFMKLFLLNRALFIVYFTSLKYPDTFKFHKVMNFWNVEVTLYETQTFPQKILIIFKIKIKKFWFLLIYRNQNSDFSNLYFSKYMASQDNMEALYTMFSRLLDRKVDELKRIQSEGSERRENNDDIKVRF